MPASHCKLCGGGPHCASCQALGDLAEGRHLASSRQKGMSSGPNKHVLMWPERLCAAGSAALPLCGDRRCGMPAPVNCQGRALPGLLLACPVEPATPVPPPHLR